MQLRDVRGMPICVARPLRCFGLTSTSSLAPRRPCLSTPRVVPVSSNGTANHRVYPVGGVRPGNLGTKLTLRQNLGRIIAQTFQNNYSAFLRRV